MRRSRRREDRGWEESKDCGKAYRALKVLSCMLRHKAVEGSNRYLTYMLTKSTLAAVLRTHYRARRGARSPSIRLLKKETLGLPVKMVA